MKRLLAMSLVGLWLFAGAAEARDVRVSLRDVDFTTEQGVERGYARLERAAREVCQAETLYAMLRAQRICERDTLNVVLAQINAPSLWARRQAERQYASLR